MQVFGFGKRRPAARDGVENAPNGRNGVGNAPSGRNGVGNAPSGRNGVGNTSNGRNGVGNAPNGRNGAPSRPSARNDQQPPPEDYHPMPAPLRNPPQDASVESRASPVSTSVRFAARLPNVPLLTASSSTKRIRNLHTSIPATLSPCI
jgi:hypothetical protein